MVLLRYGFARLFVFAASICFFNCVAAVCFVALHDFTMAAIVKCCTAHGHPVVICTMADCCHCEVVVLHKDVGFGQVGCSLCISTLHGCDPCCECCGLKCEKL